MSAWLISLVAMWTWSANLAAPELAELRETSREQAHALTELRQTMGELRQRVATLSRSDEISRRANADLQQTLAEREEEIAQLRSDVAFYERLVGSTGQRRGLTVHSVRMQPATNGIWHYSVTLTQNLNRGATTSGEMSLQVEGVRDGRLVTIRWDELAPVDADAQAFSFRYFQQVEGSVMLPEDFVPQRVRVDLRTDGGTMSQAFPWEATTENAASAAGR